jgi:hypothetical protein
VTTSDVGSWVERAVTDMVKIALDNSERPIFVLCTEIDVVAPLDTRSSEHATTSAWPRLAMNH